MKIAILGAGAMGSLYASYLIAAHDVSLIDSYKPQVDKINIDGLIKINPDKSEETFMAKAVLSGTNIGIQDLVIVFVKGLHTYQAMKENLTLIGPNTIVMSLQNGAGNNKDIRNFVSKRKIIVGTSSHNSVSMELGKFYHSGCGPTNIGPDYPCNESIADVKIVAHTLTDCGLDVNVIENIQKVLWQKLLVNCGINALSTVMQCKLGEVYTNPYLWSLCKKIIYECTLVAEADGTYFDRMDAIEIVKDVCQNNASGYASMYQDRINLRLTEIDRINGVVANLGKEYGISTPNNTILVEQIHAIEQMY
ncbi:MAG: ketopantoate reductase family protein [Lachnotalea sp.]